MSDRKQIDQLIGPLQSQRVMRALKGGATRRDILAMLAACGMQDLMAGSLASTAVLAHAETPRHGGKIRVAGEAGSSTDTLDPAKQSNQTDYSRGCMLYNGLFTLDGSLTPQPELAEAYSTKDAKTWVFKLRKGVVFHDGKDLSPADVAFSLLRHKDPATASNARVLAEQIVSAKATGPNEVTVVLSAPNADWPAVLGTFHFHIVKDGTTDFNAGIGTGPFKLKEFQPGVRSLVVRNESYWKPGKPYLDEIEFVGIGDESTRVNALLSGGIDMAASIKPYSVQRVRNTPGYSVFVTQSGQYTDLIMRKDMGPGANPNFVMAMKCLLDREQMKQAIVQEFGSIANDQPIHSSNRFYASDLPQRVYDPEKAKFYLKKAGFSGAIQMVASSAATYSVEFALCLQQSARQVGLDLDVRRVSSDDYWSTHWLTDPVVFGNVNARPTADILFTQFFKSDARWNESRWKSAKFDQLLLAARMETKEAKRKQMYADMQALVHNEAGLGIPLFIAYVDAHSAKLKGLLPIPLGGLMGYAFAESVWLAA